MMGCCPVVEPGKDYDYPPVEQTTPARHEPKRGAKSAEGLTPKRNASGAMVKQKSSGAMVKQKSSGAMVKQKSSGAMVKKRSAGAVIEQSTKQPRKSFS